MKLNDYAANASNIPPVAPAVPSVGYPSVGDPQAGVRATLVGDYWFYQVQQEIANLLVAAGLTADSADLTQLGQAVLALGAGNLQVADAAALREVDVKADIRVAQTLGALASGDGGGGMWRWDTASTEADNLGTVLLPAGHTGAGRWLRVYHGGAEAAWWGMSASNTAAGNKSALESALVAALDVRLPAGTIPMNGPVYVRREGSRVIGCGIGATILAVANSAVGIIAGNAAGDSNSVHHIHIMDFSVSGGTIGIQLGSSQSPLTFLGSVQRIKITNASDVGLYAYQCVAEICNVECLDNANGFRFSDGVSTATRLSGIRAYHNVGYGVHLSRCYGLAFIGGVIEQNGGPAVVCHPVDENSVGPVSFIGTFIEKNCRLIVNSAQIMFDLIATTGYWSNRITFRGCTIVPPFNPGSGAGHNAQIAGYVLGLTVENCAVFPYTGWLNLTNPSISDTPPIVELRGNHVLDDYTTSAIGINGQNVAGQTIWLAPYPWTTAPSAGFFTTAAAANAGTYFRTMTCGTDTDRVGMVWVVDGANATRIWADNSGTIRVKQNSDPTSHSDGIALGTQTFSGTHCYPVGDEDLIIGEAVYLDNRKLRRCTAPQDPRCIGIYAGRHVCVADSFGVATPMGQDLNDDHVYLVDNFPALVISLGDTIFQHDQIDCDGALVDGPVSAGDLLCTGHAAGRLTKQADNVVRNYTVALAVEDGDAGSPVYCYVMR